MSNGFPPIVQDENWLQTLRQVGDWFTTPMGEMLLTAEQSLLEEVLSHLLGSYLVHCGPPCPPEKRGNILNAFHVGPALPGVDVICDECAWPFSEHAADVVVLQHALDFCRSPHYLLREAAKTVRPGGHLIVMGLNPMSLWGLAHQFSRGVLRHARCIPTWRTADWLNLLGFAIEQRSYGCYRPPLASPVWQNRLQAIELWGPRLRGKSGGFYLVLARKLHAGLRPLRNGKPEPLRGKLVTVPVAVGRKS